MRIRRRQLLDGLGDQPAFKIRRLGEQVSSVVSTEEAATEFEAKLKEAEAKVVSLEKELEIAMLDVESLETEKEKLRLTEAHSEAHVGKLERELTLLAHSHSAEREALQTQVVELQSSLATKCKELGLTEAQVGKLQRDLNSLVDLHSAEREASQTQVVKLESSFAGRSKELRLSEAQVGKLERELNSLVDSHSAEREALQTQVTELESSLAGKSKELRLTETQVGKLERELNSLAASHSAEKEALHTQIVELESSLAEKSEGLGLTEAQVGKLERQLNSLADSHSAEREVLQTQVAELESSLVAKRKKLRHTKAQVGKLERDLNLLADSDTAEEEAFQTGKSKIQEDAIQSLQEKVVALETELEETAARVVHKSRRRSSMVILVKTATYETICLEVQSLDTIRKVKEKIEEKAGIRPDMYQLTFGGRMLDDGLTVAEYNIQKEDTLFSRRADPEVHHGPFQIFVEYRDQEISLEVESSDTIFTVKKKIQDKERIPFKEQRLYYAVALEDERTLAQYNIKFFSKLFLMTLP